MMHDYFNASGEAAECERILCAGGVAVFYLRRRHAKLLRMHIHRFDSSLKMRGGNNFFKRWLYFSYSMYVVFRVWMVSLRVKEIAFPMFVYSTNNSCIKATRGVETNGILVKVFFIGKGCEETDFLRTTGIEEYGLKRLRSLNLLAEFNHYTKINS